MCWIDKSQLLYFNLHGENNSLLFYFFAHTMILLQSQSTIYDQGIKACPAVPIRNKSSVLKMWSKTHKLCVCCGPTCSCCSSLMFESHCSCRSLIWFSCFWCWWSLSFFCLFSSWEANWTKIQTDNCQQQFKPTLHQTKAGEADSTEGQGSRCISTTYITYFFQYLLFTYCMCFVCTFKVSQQRIFTSYLCCREFFPPPVLSDQN